MIGLALPVWHVHQFALPRVGRPGTGAAGLALTIAGTQGRSLAVLFCWRRESHPVLALGLALLLLAELFEQFSLLLGRHAIERLSGAFAQVPGLLLLSLRVAGAVGQFAEPLGQALLTRLPLLTRLLLLALLLAGLVLGSFAAGLLALLLALLPVLLLTWFTAGLLLAPLFLAGFFARLSAWLLTGFLAGLLSLLLPRLLPGLLSLAGFLLLPLLPLFLVGILLLAFFLTFFLTLFLTLLLARFALASFLLLALALLLLILILAALDLIGRLAHGLAQLALPLLGVALGLLTPLGFLFAQLLFGAAFGLGRRRIGRWRLVGGRLLGLLVGRFVRRLIRFRWGRLLPFRFARSSFIPGGLIWCSCLLLRSLFFSCLGGWIQLLGEFSQAFGGLAPLLFARLRILRALGELFRGFGRAVQIAAFQSLSQTLGGPGEGILCQSLAIAGPLHVRQGVAQGLVGHLSLACVLLHGLGGFGGRRRRFGHGFLWIALARCEFFLDLTQAFELLFKPIVSGVAFLVRHLSGLLFERRG